MTALIIESGKAQLHKFLIMCASIELSHAWEFVFDVIGFDCAVARRDVVINVLLYNGVVHLSQLYAATDARCWEQADRLLPAEIKFLDGMIMGVRTALNPRYVTNIGINNIRVLLVRGLRQGGSDAAWPRRAPLIDPGHTAAWMGEVSSLLRLNDIMKVAHFATAPCVEEWCSTDLLRKQEANIMEKLRQGMCKVSSSYNATYVLPFCEAYKARGVKRPLEKVLTFLFCNLCTGSFGRTNAKRQVLLGD